MAKLPRLDDVVKINAALQDMARTIDSIAERGLEKVFRIDTTSLTKTERRIEVIGMFSKRWGNQLDDLNKKIKKQREDAERLKKIEQEQLKRVKEYAKVVGSLTRRKNQSIGGFLNPRDAERLRIAKRGLSEWSGSLVETKKSQISLSKEISKTPSIEAALGKASTAIAIGAAITVVTQSVKLLGQGIRLLEAGIQRVYDLHERWSKLLGSFNMKIGSMSKNMTQARAVASSWEGTMRGLTDEFGAGHQMAGEFLDSFGRIGQGKDFDRFGKLGFDMARGFNLSAQGAGEMMKALQVTSLDEVMSDDPREGAKQYAALSKSAVSAFGHIMASAKAAGMPVNKLSKMISESRSWMITFGKSGQAMFIKMAGYAAKLGVSLKSLQQFTKITDTFDSTAEAAAKLNTIFGTTINSLDLMLEQDPSKRFEMVRQQMLGQGKTFQSLSRQEREFMAETLNIAEEDVAAMLKSGQTLEEFERKKAKQKENEKNSEAAMRKQTMATAQTMFAFGQAADNLTKKLEFLIKPFLDLLGITQEYKDGVLVNISFSERMGGIFEEIGRIIDKVGSNENFQNMMSKAAGMTKRLFTSVSNFVETKDFDKLIDSASRFGSSAMSLLEKLMPTIEALTWLTVKAVTVWLDFASVMAGFWGGVKDKIDWWVQGWFSFFLEKIPNAVKSVVGFTADVIKTVMATILSVPNAIIAAFDRILAKVDDFVQRISGAGNVASMVVGSLGSVIDGASGGLFGKTSRAIDVASKYWGGGDVKQSVEPRRPTAVAKPVMKSPTVIKQKRQEKKGGAESNVRQNSSNDRLAQTLVAGDVYLDSTLVGRHLARTMISPE